MITISVNGLNKYYGANHVLKGLSFEVFEGERVGLLGKNGAGKSTLFKILAGLETFEGGSVSIPNGVKVGVLDQIPQYPENYTVLDVLMTAFESLVRLKTEMNELEKAMAAGADEKLIKRYGQIQSSFENQGGYTMESEIAKVCNGLGINEDMQQRPFNLLSGGEKTKINLGRILLNNTNVLLLDEPTNHLDIASTEWIEGFLTQYKGTVIVISHDRYFLDTVVNRIIEINDGKAELFQGNYSYYVDEKEARYLQQLAQYEQEQKKIKQLEEAARKMHEWANNADNPLMHRRAFAIEKRIERMNAIDRPVKDRGIASSFQQENFSGKEIAILEGVSKSYGENKILDDISIKVFRGERVALLGRNGCGKTTLLKLITNEEQPDTGIAKLGESIKYALLQQNIVFEKPERTVLDTVRYELEISDSNARSLLAVYKFRGNDVFKKVEALSGGEKTRLKLCLLMQKDVNMLILDEPTNHLDIASREWIEECVEEFGGTILFVSHDRYFISRFAEKIWELEDGKISTFQGTYEEYKQSKIRLPEVKEKEKAKEPKQKPQTRQRKSDEEIREKEQIALEQQIAQLEGRIKEIDIEMEQAGSDYQQLELLLQEKQELSGELDNLYEKWMG